MKLLNNLDLNSLKIKNLAEGTLSGDAVRKSQLDAVEAKFNSGLKYKGTFDASAGNFTSISPGSNGDFYKVSVGGTISGVLFSINDMLLINKDTQTVTISDVDKVDNTESEDIVNLSGSQTLSNKTIDSDNNTLTNLVLSSFKSGTVVTDIATDSDTTVPTEGAVISYVASQIAAKKYASLIGNGVNSSFEITHGLASEDVIVSLKDVATKQIVNVNIVITSSSKVTVDFEDLVPTENQYKVIILS